LVTQERPLGSQADLGEAAVRLEAGSAAMRLHPDGAELADNQRPALGEGQAPLQAEKFNVAAAKDRVARGCRLVHEDGANFSESPGIFEEKRVADGRSEVVKAMIAFKEMVPAFRVVISAAEPGKAAAEVLGLFPEGETCGGVLIGDATVVLLGRAGRHGRAGGGRRWYLQGGGTVIAARGRCRPGGGRPR